MYLQSFFRGADHIGYKTVGSHLTTWAFQMLLSEVYLLQANTLPVVPRDSSHAHADIFDLYDVPKIVPDGLHAFV
jgi:hypothetical protein